MGAPSPKFKGFSHAGSYRNSAGTHRGEWWSWIPNTMSIEIANNEKKLRLSLSSHLTELTFDNWYRTGCSQLPVKGQTVNIWGFAGHTVSVTTIHFCHRSMKAATDKTQTNEWLCLSETLFTKTLQPDFHVIFMHHKIFFFRVFSTFYKSKHHSYFTSHTKTRGSPWAWVCQPLMQDECLVHTDLLERPEVKDMFWFVSRRHVHHL